MEQIAAMEKPLGEETTTLAIGATNGAIEGAKCGAENELKNVRSGGYSKLKKN
jgi:hypothetical protein